MVQIVERFRDPVTNVPKERLACGHIKTDPSLHYSNEKAFAVGRIGQAISGQLPKARCWKCARNITA